MPALEVRTAPFSTTTSPHAKVRPILAVVGRYSSATLKRPHAELPVLAVSDIETLFELPVIHDWELAPGESCAVEFERNGGSRTTEPLPRSWLEAGSQAGGPAVRFVYDHVAALGEFLFPSSSGVRQPWRSGGHAAAPWAELHQAMRRHAETQGGPLALIVQVADACQEVLNQICVDPRRLLRRERRMTHLGAADQLDESCLRWLVRQPGETIVDKAGAQQRILAVQRTHSYDTTENRVVRDFLERCRRACDAYLRDNDDGSGSARVRRVHTFRRDTQRWLGTSPIAQVPRPVGAPSANYVLQFDDRYRQVWPWYERLRRQQQDEVEIERWRNRVWAEHVLLLVAYAVVGVGEAIAYRGRSYVRARPHMGRFLDTASYYDSTRCGSPQSARLRVLSTEVDGSTALEPLAPDGVLRDCDPAGATIDGTVVGIWSALAPVDGAAAMAELGGVLADRLHSSGKGGMRGLLVLPLRVVQSSTNDACPIAVRATNQVLVIALPAPCARHLGWLRTTVTRWIDRRRRIVVRWRTRPR